MIQFKCQVDKTLKYTMLLPFQGNLKKRSDEDIKKLAASILEDGLLMPFVVWVYNGLIYILDGHARYSAIQYIAETMPDVLAQEYPVIEIDAPDFETAKLSLLQISSQYGKITPKGLQTFIADSPKINIQNLSIRLPKPQVKIEQRERRKEKIIKIAVPEEYSRDVINMLLEVGYIRVLA